MSSVLQASGFTVAAYLAQERQAANKNEFHHGEIFAMTGASRKHNLVALNIASELRTQLKNRSCEAYVSDMRVKAASANNYYYPDLAIVCATPQFEDAFVDTLLNPTVLFEVFSPSTEAYDRGCKFANYRKIDSLCDYVLVAQDQPCIERFTRHGNDWVLTVAEGLAAELGLESIACVLNLREVYDKVLVEEG